MSSAFCSSSSKYLTETNSSPANIPACSAGESSSTFSTVSEVSIAIPNESMAIGLLGPSVEASLGNSGSN